MQDKKPSQARLPFIKKLSSSRKGKKEIHTCKICDGKFEVLLSDLKRPHNLGIYCSRGCSQIGHPRGVAITKKAWNKGLKLRDHPAIEKYARKLRGELNPMFGKISPRRGKKHTQKSKLKMSKSRIGLFTKDKNPNWKGGKTMEGMLIRTSKQYREWRLKILERDGYICVECGQVPFPIHVDHIKPFSKYPELRMDLNNGRTMCVACHKKTETYGTKASKY